jgi:hypothetical protein
MGALVLADTDGCRASSGHSRRGAEDHHKREIRKPALYEALSFVEQYLEKKNWLVRRYRNAKEVTSPHVWRSAVIFGRSEPTSCFVKAKCFLELGVAENATGGDFFLTT